MEDEREPFRRSQRLEHDQERKADRVGDQSLVLWRMQKVTGMAALSLLVVAAFAAALTAAGIRIFSRSAVG